MEPHMQHNIKKIKEILVPYTAEENAELSGGEDTAVSYTHLTLPTICSV